MDCKILVIDLNHFFLQKKVATLYDHYRCSYGINILILNISIMKNTLKNNCNQVEFHQFVTRSYADLIRLKKEENKSSFNELMLKILPQVKIYIVKKLNKAIKDGTIPKGKYKADDFIDQLYIETFDHIDEIENEKDLYPWLFKKVDELLEDTKIDEEFDDFFFKNIDNYSKQEWDAMEEKYSRDADGDLVMLEDLDDISYNKNNYTLNNVFVENKEPQIIEALDKKLSEERIRKHIQMVVQQLPERMQTVFDLAVSHQFKPSDIAKIKKISTQEVVKLLNKTRDTIKISLKKRFLTVSI